MPKSSLTSSNPEATKESKSVAPKRSLTPRRRAREYALQGVYQSLVVRRAGSLPNSAAIAKQLSEDPAFRRLCTAAIFFDVLSGVFISLTVLELFFFQAGAVRSLQATYVIWTFVLGLIFFMTSLSIVLAEVVYAYRSASWNSPKHY